MKNWTPYVIAACVIGYLAIDTASTEYAKIRSAIGETKQKADSLADETKATMESIKQTIDDLRAKFTTLETQMQARESTDVDEPSEPVKEEPKPTEKPAQKPSSQPTIVMYSASWCGPCQRWKREAMAQWQGIGWKVDVIEDDSISGTIPKYEITDSDGLQFSSVGFLTRETFARDRAAALNAKRQGAPIE